MKDRIIKLMESEGLSPAQFAETVGIQRSAVSHLVTGRNKPSLEVVQKILNAFRLINSDWLILGVGAMYRKEKQFQQPTLFSEEHQTRDVERVSANVAPEKTLSPKTPIYTEPVQEPAVLPPPPVLPPIPATGQAKTVRNIIVYYSNGTFEEFAPK
jgi:transcriptional regulator with XRE-family HTH domain